MTPERWQRVEQLLQSALKLEENYRADFLKQACAGDEVLRREVESLLAHREHPEDFISFSPNTAREV
jgi:eukaryotic-like serine/threonine-protein kinase